MNSVPNFRHTFGFRSRGSQSMLEILCNVCGEYDPAQAPLLNFAVMT